ncbi:MAG: ATP-dependent DNA helicase RecG [Oscillospiraceae bacterium]|nr:ATP-dependent DNA helicase RecG [Oscillospiraceae bacterium]
MNSKVFDTSIRYLKGVGEAREKLFNKLGIRTLRDLVEYFPRAYEDRTVFKRINSLVIGEYVCVRAIAAATPKLSHIRKGLDLVKLRVVDDVGSLEITFFNSPFVKDAIKQGESYAFYGKVSGTLLRPEMTNPLFERVQKKGAITGCIVPIYPLTAKLSQKIVSTAVRSALEKCADEFPDVIPNDISKKYNLCRASYAYENIHSPEGFKELDIARRRLIFEELFVLVTAMRLMRDRRTTQTGKYLQARDFKEFYASLSFTPTNAQKRAIDDAAADMIAGKLMNRLIQGDVGSGKTLVAAACCWLTWRSGLQSAFMAPTEILAKQHYKSLTDMLTPFGMSVGLLTGSTTAKGKHEIYEQLRYGEIDLIIGTHALLSEGVEFRNLGLVITDEQHRFGVEQRSMLTEKGDSPHVLVMSATPIPRTLALIIYGDLDVSIIDEMPPGRREIETHVVDERYRERLYKFVRKLVSEGRQVYVICPMVEENDEDLEQESASDANKPKSVTTHHETLSKKVFPDLNVELLHGKMPAKKKDAAMAAFTSGDADILVATTVIEVGVDVPNAALIIVENADRFGLSQLHQLRGRIGRGEFQSFCVLIGEAHERLQIMKSTNDGFKIAEEDLKLRGPGDFFGSRQHGLPVMQIANLMTDMLVLHEAQGAAEKLLETDPSLSLPANRKLKEKIIQLFDTNIDKMN